MMILKAMLLTGLMTISFSAFAAQNTMQQGTPKERAACRYDVKKYCSALRPGADSFDYLHCLQANRKKLKAACLAVLTSHGQ